MKTRFFHFLALLLSLAGAQAQLLINPYSVQPGFEAGWYVDPVAGNNANNGTSPAQAWADYDNFAEFTTEFDQPIFTKIGASYVQARVLTLTTESSPTKPILAGQSITRTSGSTCVWVMGDGRVVETDTFPASPGFEYVGEGNKTIHLIFPSGTAGVTAIGLVSGRYVPGAGMPSFAGFPNLISLDLSLNNFGGQIPDLVNLPSLESCLLDRTGTTGALGNVDLPALKTLWLWQNTLSDEFPDLSGSPNLEELRIEQNDFTGSIPVFTQNTLHTFIGYENDFGGSLPSFNACTALVTFNIADNPQITGTLPTFVACTALTSFDVNGCDFTAVTEGALSAQILLANIDFSFQINSLDPPELNKILASCVVRDAIGGSVNATLNIRQASGSVSGQGLTDKATLEASGWTVLNF